MLCPSCQAENAAVAASCAACGVALTVPEPPRAGPASDADTPATDAPRAGPASDADTPATDAPRAEPASDADTPATDAARAERRRYARRAASLSVVLKRTAPDGTLRQQERTLAEDLSRQGARVFSSFADLTPGDELEIEEVGGSFHTRVAVRAIVARPDGLTRLGLEFIERPAPERLVPRDAGEPAPPDAAAGASEAAARQAPASEPPAAVERRRDTRLDICVDVHIQGPPAGAGAAAPREERTVADNISWGGARVLTSMTRLSRGDVVTLSEVGGDFATRAAVCFVTVGADRIPRLGLKFLDRHAPDRLVLTDDVRVSRAQAAPAAGNRREPATPESEAALHAAAVARRQEVLDIYVALKQRNHFEVLGLPRAATADDVKAAYSRLARRFHPDVGAKPGIEDLLDERKAIFVRLGEAYEVLAHPRRRAEYESHLGPSREPRRTAAAPPPRADTPVRAAAAEPSATVSVPRVSTPAPPPAPAVLDREGELAVAEDALMRARRLLAEGQYWDAVRVLEPALALGHGTGTNRRLRVLHARALAHTPQWLKRAEQLLLKVVEEDTRSVEGHFGLAEVYLAARLKVRARHELERVLELQPDHRGAARALAALGKN